MLKLCICTYHYQIGYKAWMDQPVIILIPSVFILETKKFKKLKSYQYFAHLSCSFVKSPNICSYIPCRIWKTEMLTWKFVCLMKCYIERLQHLFFNNPLPGQVCLGYNCMRCCNFECIFSFPAPSPPLSTPFCSFYMVVTNDREYVKQAMTEPSSQTLNYTKPILQPCSWKTLLSRICKYFWDTALLCLSSVYFKKSQVYLWYYIFETLNILTRPSSVKCSNAIYQRCTCHIIHTRNASHFKNWNSWKAIMPHFWQNPSKRCP